MSFDLLLRILFVKASSKMPYCLEINKKMKKTSSDQLDAPFHPDNKPSQPFQLAYNVHCKRAGACNRRNLYSAFLRLL